MIYYYTVKSIYLLMCSFKPDELELRLGFLADAFDNKRPNMLKLFQMMVNKDIFNIFT